jgi:hypothetical protein
LEGVNNGWQSATKNSDAEFSVKVSRGAQEIQATYTKDEVSLLRMKKKKKIK